MQLKKWNIGTLKSVAETLRQNAGSIPKIDPFRLTEKIANTAMRLRALDMVLNVSIPFNRWLGLRLEDVSDERVVVASPATVLRRNHVGSAHACALALIGEYPAGLLVAQRYPLSAYRMIIGGLSIDYHKQGRGLLRGTALAPAEWPEVTGDGAWIEMTTEIVNAKGEAVATCRTKWQVKRWSDVGARGRERAT